MQKLAKPYKVHYTIISALLYYSFFFMHASLHLWNNLLVVVKNVQHALGKSMKNTFLSSLNVTYVLSRGRVVFTSLALNLLFLCAFFINSPNATVRFRPPTANYSINASLHA